MASVNITKEQFVDYIVAFLLDKTYKSDVILPDYDAFNELMKQLKARGIDNILLNYYINSNPEIRSKYKATRKVFKKGNKDSLIMNIKGEVEREKKTKGTLKSLVKKALKLMTAHKRRSGFPLSEKKVDKIIERVMIEEGFLLEDKE